MQQKKEKRFKAQGDIAAIISFIVFLGAVLLVIVYVNHSSDYSTLKKQEMFKTASEVIKDRFVENAKESVYLYFIELSNFSGENPIEFSYNFSFENASANSTVVLDSTFNAIASDIQNNTIIFNAKEPKKPYFLAIFPNDFDGNKSAISYETDITNGTDYINNTQVYVGFKSTGIQSIEFYGVDILQTKGGLLSTTSFENINTGFARSEGLFDDDKKVKIYENNSLISIKSPLVFNSDLYFVNYNYFYNGAQNTFDDDQTQSLWSGTSDMIALYNDNDGVAIIGENLNIEILINQTYWREIKITGADNYKIIPYYGNYTHAIALKEKYLHDINVSIGLKNKIYGITDESLNHTAERNYYELKKELGLSGADMNISFPQKNTGFGKTIPNNKAVFVFNYPVVFIDRYANKTVSLMKFAIWRSVD